MSRRRLGLDEPNIEIYTLLFELETVLRELIIERLTAISGPTWYRKRFPAEAAEHYRLGIHRDRETNWTRNIPHHPVYYLTFPDLRLIIEQKDNWNECFRAIFPRTKELVTTDLIELEFIRNKVAHNRRASIEDVTIVRAAHSKVMAAIGASEAAVLLKRYSVVQDIPQQLSALEHEANVSTAIVASRGLLKYLPGWDRASKTWWWFDDTYLGTSTADIRALFEALAEARAGGDPPVSLNQQLQMARQQFKRARDLWKHLSSP